MFQKRHIVIFSVLGLLLLASVGCSLRFFSGASGSDWLMWRHDANRSAASPHKLSDDLYLQWVRDYPKLTQAWENPLNRDLMQFDKVYEPVVQGKNFFVGSSISDRMVALDTETGAEKWSFYVNGPVRLPPVAHNGNVYFVSDDGYIYCVDGEKGTLVWKFRGGPSDKKILGNERMVSTWLARGGPVLKDGIIYFGAGIWPFMGIFIYALDAETGEVVWDNDSTGPIYMRQPHNSPSYAGLAPQGSFVISGDKLLIPCGRSIPACLDRRTGEYLYYRLSNYAKTGGAFVCAQGDYFVNYHRDYVTSLCDISRGDSIISRFGKIPVMTKKTLFSMGSSVTAFDLGNLRQVERDESLVVDTKKEKVEASRSKKWVLDQLWNTSVDASGDLIKAGNRLYAGGKDVVTAVSIPRFGSKPKVKWRTKIEGTATRIIAADDKLFVVTLEGRIYAFGKREVVPRVHIHTVEKSTLTKSALARAAHILENTGVKAGYCLAYGLKTGDLVEALVRNSQLRIIAVDPDQDKVDSLRRKFDAAGLYGKRLTVQVGDPFKFDAPPYMASLTVFENLEAAGYGKGDAFLKQIYDNIRPYGGIACLPVSSGKMSAVAQRIQKLNLPRAKVRKVKRSAKLRRSGGHVLLIRQGALAGAADWTHQYGDIANTVKSDDQLVKLPLGILWFGGSSNMDVLPRHGHGPPEQVIGGRLFIEGMDGFSARDVYTGQVLWKRTLSSLDTYDVYYDATYKNTPLDPAYNQVHIPGANARGTNFVATLDKVYIAVKNGCLVLDSATGKTIDEFKMPEDPRTGLPAEWGYIGVYKNYLIAGAEFVSYLDFLESDEILPAGTSSKRLSFYNFDITSSKKLVVMNRHTGEILWTRDSELGFKHNAVAVGDGKVFCIDTLPNPIANALERRLGEYHYGKSRLIALNVRNGKIIWDTDKDVFGTWLGYSAEYDILIESGRSSRDMMRGEPSKGLAAYRGKNGKVLWSNDVSRGGPYILHGDTIITDRYAYSLLDGEQKKRVDPLTGEERPWAFRRNYGCNYAIASEHLLTFRSAAAGFFDLANDGGTGNFGGFKTGCTSNLIAADGLLNAPDYTRTCSCSYQNQSSLAMLHAPEVEIWTDYYSERESNVITSAASAVAFFDLKGNLTYVNSRALKLLGYSDETDVLGESVSKFVQAGDATTEAIATLLDEGEWIGDLVVVKEDDSTLDVHISASVGADSVMASFVDITTSAVAFFDLEGNLTYVNSPFLRLLEYDDEDDVLGKPIAEFWQTQENILAALRDSGKWKGELVVVKEDSSIIDVYLSASMVLDEFGIPVAMTASFVDATERKKVRKAVNRLDAALRVSRDIKQLIADEKPVRSVGINFGAPGDRRADDGTLWLEYPIVGGSSPNVPVTIDHDKLLFTVFDADFKKELDKKRIPEKLQWQFENRQITLIPYATVSVEEKGIRWTIAGSRRRSYLVEKTGYWLNIYPYERFSHHSSRIQGDGLKWVAASGIKGISSVTVTLARKLTDTDGDSFVKERLYTIRLFFSEPDDVKQGQRRFDVAVQGQKVLTGFDTVEAAGGRNRLVVKEFKGIPVKYDLTLAFTPSSNATMEPLICGVSVMSDE